MSSENETPEPTTNRKDDAEPQENGDSHDSNGSAPLAANDTHTDNETEEPPLIPANYSIPLHTLLHTAQQSHGLLHDDYTAYRAYLTRRLSRLRHAPPVYKALTHGSKSAHGGGGGGGGKKNMKRHAYHPRMEEKSVEEVNSHVHHVLVMMYGVERAWAHSKELKAQWEELRSQALVGGNGPRLGGKPMPSPASKRQHSLKRLKKAVVQVEELERMGKVVCDERTQMEIACYAGWMKGNWFTEKKEWKSACEAYASALKQCHVLSSTNDSTAESLQLSDFFHSRATNTLQPLFRFTLYELEKETGKDNIPPLVAELMQQEQQQQPEQEGEVGSGELESKPSSETISFRGCQIPLNDGAIRLAFLKIETCQSELASSKKKDSKKDAKFLQVLTAYEDCIELVQKSVKEYEGMGSGPAVNRKRQEFVSLLGYCQFEKLKLLMDRNEQLVNSLRQSDFEIVRSKVVTQEDADAKYKRVEEITHLYDALLQNARMVVTLPGGISEGDDEEELEDEFVLEAKANVLRLRAFRCYYMGRMYAADVVAKYVEALALYDQATTLAMEAAEEIAACQDMDRADELIESIDALEEEITGAKCRAEACAYLAKCGSGASSATSSATLLRRLDDFDSGGRTFRLANVPPALEPIPCKPAFYDIAHNYVADFLDHELEHHVNVYKPKEKGGFLSWFKK